MRTTLDLDERVVVAAKARARQRGATLGAAVSELALAGLDADASSAEPATRHSLVLLPSTPGHTITDDMVAVFADPRVDRSGLGGYRQVPDLHLVNLAAQNSGVLVTFDRTIPKTLLQRDRS